METLLDLSMNLQKLAAIRAKKNDGAACTAATDELRLLTVAVDALVEHEVKRALESVQRARAIAEAFLQRMQETRERDSGGPGSP